MQACIKSDFPFREKKFCHDCKEELTLYEAIVEHLGKCYCKSHHPYTCATCFNIVLGKILSIEDKVYHPNCVFCVECLQNVDSEIL